MVPYEDALPMPEPLYFTPRGLEKLHRQIAALETELQHLDSQVAEVAEVGGNQWHDNASYDALVIDIRGVNNRLSEAHRQLNSAVRASSPTGDVVAIGTTITIEMDGQRDQWTIVGYGESDPDNDLIAYNTPLASQLLGKRRGESLSARIGDRTVAITICGVVVADQ